MKEYIDIEDKNGNFKKAEVIFRFHDKKSGCFFIVYKYENDYFAAKYEDIIGISKLDTNLSAEEIDMLEKALNEIEDNNYEENNDK